MTKSNLLTDDPQQADPNFQVLAGKIRSKSIELDLAAQVTDQQHLLGTYAYTQADYIEDFDGRVWKTCPDTRVARGAPGGLTRRLK